MILCYLEGKTQDEAARQLGWSKSTLRRRLESGRSRLRLRLEQRGLTLPAALAGSLLSTNSVLAVPTALMHATLNAALTGVGFSPAVVTLAQGGVRMLFLHKLKVVCATLMLFTATGVGLGTIAVRIPGGNGVAAPAPMALVAPEKELIQPKPDPKNQAPRVDFYGDPLPPGALARLGTVHFRHRHASVAFSADGKTLVSAGGGEQGIRFWDVASGRLMQSKPFERPAALANTHWQVEDPVFSPDGKYLAALGGRRSVSLRGGHG